MYCDTNTSNKQGWKVKGKKANKRTKKMVTFSIYDVYTNCASCRECRRIYTCDDMSIHLLQCSFLNESEQAKQKNNYQMSQHDQKSFSKTHDGRPTVSLSFAMPLFTDSIKVNYRILASEIVKDKQGLNNSKRSETDKNDFYSIPSQKPNLLPPKYDVQSRKQNKTKRVTTFSYKNHENMWRDFECKASSMFDQSLTYEMIPFLSLTATGHELIGTSKNTPSSIKQSRLRVSMIRWYVF